MLAALKRMLDKTSPKKAASGKRNRWLAGPAILGAVVLPILGVGVFSFEKTKKDLTELAFSQKRSTAHLTAITVKEKFDRLKDISTALATRVQFRKLVAEGKWEEAIIILAQVPKDFPFIDRVMLADTAGNLKADAPELPGVRGVNFSYRDWYRGVMERRNTYLSDVYIRLAKPQIKVVAAAVPIKGERDEMAGVMVLQVSLATLCDWSQHIENEGGGVIYLVDKKGRIAAHPKYSAADTMVDFSPVPIVQRLREGKAGLEVSYNPVEGAENLAAYEPVPGYGWGVVAQEPAGAAFAERDANLRRLSAIFAFVLILSMVMAWLILRSLAERRKTEERFRKLLEAAPDAMVIAGGNGRIMLVNAQAEKLFGYDGEQMIGMTVEQLMPERYRGRHVGNRTDFMKEPKVRAMGTGLQLYGLRRDGTEFPVEISLSPIETERGRLVTAAIRDITERKRLDETLRDSEQRYRLLFDENPLPAWVFDLETLAFLAVNRAAVRHYGYSEEEFLKMTIKDIRPTEDVPALLEHISKLKEGTHPPGEWRHCKKDGAVIAVEIVSHELFYGGKRAELVLANDITERKRVEEVLRKSEEKFRTLFDSLDVGICTIEVLFDKNGKPVDYRFLEVNSSFEKQTGIQNAPGRRMREIAPLHEEHWFEIYGNIARTGEPMRFENQAAQLHRWYDVYAFRVGEPQERRVAIHFNDITARKEVEREIEKLNESLRQHAAQLEAANKELEAFSYSVSHDLRAPLRSIDGFSQALLEDCGDRLDDSGKDYLARVRGACLRMAQLIDDMLNLSRVSRGEMRMETVDLTRMAREIVSELQKQAPERKVTCVIADNLTGRGDPRLLRVALENLLGNAWKYTSKHPTARIEFAAQRQPDGKTAFFVRDDGAGFDMAYAGKLFGAFQRLHVPSEFPGTGVGLATVQRIIHRHGGRVWMEGAVEQGATFYFTL